MGEAEVWKKKCTNDKKCLLMGWKKMTTEYHSSNSYTSFSHKFSVEQQSGTIKRLYSNKFTNTYTWGEALKVHEKDGKLFVYIDNKAKLNIETAIASAWSVNKDNKKYPIYKGVEGWSWTKNSECESDESDDDDKVILEEETEEWKLLEENKEYMISSLGRIKNRKGEVCVPTYCRGKRIVCIPKTCAIDVDYYMRRYFDIGTKRAYFTTKAQKVG